MATIKSIFGAYAESRYLQYLVDGANDRFAPTWFQNYFTWGPRTTSLNYVTVIGKSRVEAAATVIDRGSKAPLRGRPGVDRLTGVVPAIAEKFAMDEETLRTHMMLRDLPSLSDADKKQQILDLILNDVRKAADSTNKRIDIMCLEAVSTGAISLTTTNNPDGVVLPTALDLLMDDANRINSSVNWTGSPTTAKPITVDFKTIANLARGKGGRVVKALMTWDSFFAFIDTTEVKALFETMFGAGRGTLLPTLDGMNEFLRRQNLPIIEIVDVSIGVEKDGVVTPYNPFANTNIAFVPEGNLGTIHNAYAIEEMQPINQVSYAKADRTLISKWGDNDPYQEYTKAELNAMPGVDAIDGMYLLSRTQAFL
jgi:hypothetical protein